MTRDEAIAILNQNTGFRATGHAQTDFYISMLQAAQRDLERGKTLPKFLLQEDQTLSLIEGANTVALPTGFLRDDDDNSIHYVPTTSNTPTFLQRKRTYKDAVNANMRETTTPPITTTPVAPTVYVIRNSTIDFITTSNDTYTLYWNYYKAADVLTSSVENSWLLRASDWLIGEAGERIARSQRDQLALVAFQDLKQKGRAAVFGDLLALEDSGGPITMGEDN